VHRPNSRQIVPANASIHILTAYEAGIPSSVMRLRMLQAIAKDRLVAHERFLGTRLLVIARLLLPLAQHLNAGHKDARLRGSATQAELCYGTLLMRLGRNQEGLATLQRVDAELARRLPTTDVSLLVAAR
jgi:hypothetical protein